MIEEKSPIISAHPNFDRFAYSFSEYAGILTGVYSIMASFDNRYSADSMSIGSWIGVFIGGVMYWAGKAGNLKLNQQSQKELQELVEKSDEPILKQPSH